jgi:N-dimethylarginine dimethylaminohydrolase
MSGYGGHVMAGRLRRVLMRHPRNAWPRDQLGSDWRALGYMSEPDADLAVKQYRGFVTLLKDMGAEPVFLDHAPHTGPDSIYTHDPLLITDRGAILGRMGKAARRGEPEAMLPLLEALGIPVLGRIEPPGLLEGGDVIWLDQRTAAVGIGYRTNLAGADQLEHLLTGIADQLILVDLPHWTGPAECLHLMSLVSPVDRDLLVVYSRLLAAPFRELLLDRGFRLVEVPDAEFATMGPNVLAVAPRSTIVIAGNPVTRTRLEAAGAEVRTFDGSEICLKGGGGPTCLTRPVLRDPLP